MDGECETSPCMCDNSKRYQFKNSNKCSLYGDTMPLLNAHFWCVKCNKVGTTLVFCLLIRIISYCHACVHCALPSLLYFSIYFNCFLYLFVSIYFNLLFVKRRDPRHAELEQYADMEIMYKTGRTSQFKELAERD